MGNFSMKLASTVSATAIVASAMSASLVSAASEFLPYAEALAKNKVINAQSTEAGYRLNDYITRAELAKVAANLGQYTSVSCTGNVYTDVTKSLGDLCDAIETLAAAKVVSTANTTFRPNANVTRAEMTKMILGALGETQSMTSAGYSDVNSTLGDLEGFINKAAEKGIVNKGMYFRPNANGSRGEVFKIAAKAANLQVDNMPVDPNVPVQTGSVMVSAVGSASAQYVPQNASSVKVGTVKITANGGDVKLSSLSVNRSGLGNPEDITLNKGVRAMINGKIVSGNADYYNASSQQANIYFVPALELKKGQSVDVSILVSLGNMKNGDYEAAQPNSQHQFALTGVNGSNVTPVSLGLVNTTSYKAATVDAKLKEVSSNLIPARSAQRIVDVEIGSANRDVTITGFNIARSNDVDSGKKASYDLTTVLANPKVTLDGKEVGDVTMTRDKIFITGLDTLITSGRKTFQLRADVLLDSTVDQLALNIEDSSDVSGVETATQQVFRVQPNSTNVVKLNLSNVANDFKAETTKKTVAINASNVEFFNGTVTSDVPVVVNKVKVSQTNTTFQAQSSGNDNFSRGELLLKNNGRTIATLKATEVLGAGQTVDAYMVIDKDNKANITVEGTLENDASGKMKLKVELLDVKDVNGRTAKLRNTSADGAEVEVKGADVKVVKTESTSKTGRIVHNSDVKYVFTFKAENKEAAINTIKLKTISSPSKKADLSEVFDINNSTLKIDGQNVDVLASESSVDATEITLKLGELVSLDKDQDEEVELTLKTKGDVSSQNNKEVQMQLVSVTKDATTHALNRLISGVKTVGEILDVSAINSTNNQPVKFVITNSTDTDTITITGATLKIQAVRLGNTNNGNANFDVKSIKINGVVKDTTDANEFTLSETELATYGVATVSKNQSVELMIENNTLSVEDIQFVVRLETLTYGGSIKQVNIDARSTK